MTLAAVYNNLTTEQLKGMLGAARADHRRIVEEIKAKHASAIEAWRQALANAKKEWAAALQKKENEIRFTATGTTQHPRRARACSCSAC